MLLQPESHIIAENISFIVDGTTYLNCKLYEYQKTENIDSISRTVYHELGIIHENLTLTKYQTKGDYIGGVYNREIAEIRNVSDLDLSKNVEVFPNPFSDQFLIKTENTLMLNSIKVINVLGEDVSNQFQYLMVSNSEIKISDYNSLKKGIYIILITTQDYVLSKKIIKQ